MMKDLTQMPTPQLLELFRALACPTMEEMDGEFRGQQLRQPGPISTLVSALFTNNPLLFGKWQSKSFRPTGPDGGRGYNTLRNFGRETIQGPMVTLIAPSRVDGKAAYQLVYRAFHSVCGFVHMVDEVRRVDEGQYLGIGSVGFTSAQRRIPLPFMLCGPVAPYKADTGRVRAGFDLASELPGLAAAPAPRDAASTR
jgi:hypothetical protein